MEHGASAWDPVDDLWYPHWRTYDRVNDTLDDGVVRIAGADEVDFHNVGVYYVFYDTTDLHLNHARQQVSDLPCGIRREARAIPCNWRAIPCNIRREGRAIPCNRRAIPCNLRRKGV